MYIDRTKHVNMELGMMMYMGLSENRVPQNPGKLIVIVSIWMYNQFRHTLYIYIYIKIYRYIGVLKLSKIGVPPNHSFISGCFMIFHDINHPFWGAVLETPISVPGCDPLNHVPWHLTELVWARTLNYRRWWRIVRPIYCNFIITMIIITIITIVIIITIIW